VDSPLAIDATDIFRLHPECFDDQAALLAGDSNGILHAPEFHFVHTRDESKEVMHSGRPCIVIAASGMCEAGRILHHLRSGVDESRNTVLIPGFQAAHTLGRRIVERQRELPILGARIELRAEVAVLNGYSSHADSEELLRYSQPALNRCRKVFLVHGELDQSTPLAAARKSSFLQWGINSQSGQSESQPRIDTALLIEQWHKASRELQFARTHKRQIAPRGLKFAARYQVRWVRRVSIWT
jgi:metallo-beta-lactamase family protein